jgi:mannitol-specific phosphotransferase system IIBC component
MRHGKRMQQQNCFTSLVLSARSSTYCCILFFPPSFMSVCFVCRSIIKEREKWKEAKELTKKEKKAKNKKQEEARRRRRRKIRSECERREMRYCYC